MEIRFRIRYTKQGDYVADVWHPEHANRDDDYDCEGWETMLGPFEASLVAAEAVLRRYPKAQPAPVVVQSTD